MTDRAFPRSLAAIPILLVVAWCLGSLALGTVGAPFAAGLLVTGLPLAGAFAPRAVAHQRAARLLRSRGVTTSVEGTPVDIGSYGGAAFVAGLLRPRIFCDAHLIDGQLSRAEARAVTLHERAHQRARDPLRLLALATIATVARRSRRAQAWCERAAAQREIAADRYALANGARRGAIASALFKVAPVDLASASGFASATDLRLSALVEPSPPQRRRPGGWLLAVASTALAACSALMPVAAHSGPHVCC